MNTHADKTQENKSRSVAHAISKKQIGKYSVQFVDNRPEAIAQRKHQEMMSAIPQVKQLRATQEMANNNLKVEEEAQFQDAANSPIQRLVVAGDDQDNLAIASALPAATSQAGGPVQDWAAANLAGSNRVAIVAHGDINSIELDGNNYDGSQLAQQLIAKNIKSGSTLLLWACRAGMQNLVQGVSVEGSSLVEQTAEGLENSNDVDDVTITGFRGVHMFLPGDDDASRIVAPDLTNDNPTTEETWLAALGALNMHYVYLSGYFSERYLSMHMAGWQQQDVHIPFGHTRRLWTIGADIFAANTSNQTRAEFMEKERFAYHPPLLQPHWLRNQDVFNEYKRNLWRAAGMNLTTDPDFEFATLRESDETRAAMTRTRLAIDLD